MGNCLQGSETDDINLIPGDNDSDNSSAIQRRDSDETPVAAVLNDRQYRPPPPYEETLITGSAPSVVYHPSPGVSRVASELTEEEQIKIAQRIGLIQHLPVDIFAEGSKTDKECIICMLDFVDGDRIRFLPCMHTYHVHCIDDWLMRSFTCPSCLEPVDSALLTSYDQQAMMGSSSFDQLEQLTAANNSDDRALKSMNAADSSDDRANKSMDAVVESNVKSMDAVTSHVNQNTSALAGSFNNGVFEEGENEAN